MTTPRDSLRWAAQELVDTSKRLARLRRRGKKNTPEYRRTEAQQKKVRFALRAAYAAYHKED